MVAHRPSRRNPVLPAAAFLRQVSLCAKYWQHRAASAVVVKLSLALVLCAWLFPIAAAQDAVLVLTPGPSLSTSAGNGYPGFGGDNAAATLARLASPSGLAYDTAGNLFLADTANHRIRRVAIDGTITTVAGNGIQGFSGDGGTALAAQLDSPLGLAVAADSALYVADTRNHRIRRIARDGTITTVAGTGTPGFGGDTGAATDALLRNPSAVALGLLGELYIADTGNHRIRRIARDGTIATVAGNGHEEAIGDGGTALLAGLDAPTGIAVRATDGALLIADRLNSRIRVVTTDGLIATLAVGSAPLRRASGLSTDATGNVYIADRGNFRLRAVMANGSGVLLGSGEQGTPDPTVPYNTTPIGTPYAILPDSAGGVTFTDRDHAQLQHLALPQLTFADTVAGQTSPTQTISLQNTASEPLPVSAVASAATFPILSGGTCAPAPFALAGNAACTVALAFTPTAAGPQTATLTVVTTGLPQRALLTGTAVTTGTLLQSTVVLHSSGNLSYIGMPVTLQAQVLAGGTAAPTGTVHLLDASSEIAQTTLDRNSAATFTTTALTAGQHSLSARYDGDSRYAASASAVQTQTVALAPDFTITAASTSLSTTAGSTGQMALLLQPQNGTLNQQVTLRIDGLPTNATATSDAPTPLILASNAVTVTYALKTPATTAGLMRTARIIAVALLLCPWLPRNRHARTIAVTLAACLPLLLLSGCGGGYLGAGGTTSSQSVSHTYPITVTATTTGITGSALVHTATFALVVQ